ncbi:MAG: 8-amino-7-oxononanoate synthase, partial [Chromatiaceae bacterium]
MSSAASAPGLDSGQAPELAPELARLRAAGLYRRRRVQDRPQGPRAVVDGRAMLAFCGNDYLGL